MKKLCDRVLSNTLFLDALNEELAELRKPRHTAAARRELAAVIRAELESRSFWPEEPAARAALLIFLLVEKKLPPLRFTHRRDRNRLPNGNSKFSSVLIHRPVRRPS